MFRVRRLAAALFLAVLAALPATADEVRESRSAGAAVARARPAVVSMRVFGGGRDGYGAGVIVDARGYVLTAYHVVDGAAAISVELADGTEIPARLHARDAATDIALLRLLAPGRVFPVATLGGDDEIGPGETVLALSNPFGIGTSATKGILSARDRRDVVKGNIAGLLQTDAAINPGSSGGALLDLDGRVVGLITAILTRTGGHQGIGFAVPAHVLKRSLPHLIARRPVPRPWLGARISDAVKANGLKVQSVVPGGPADRAGVRPGDVLVSLEGASLRRLADLSRIVERADEDTAWDLGIERGGRLIDVRLAPAFRVKTPR